ncbi:MAG: excinuclease ABC subunit C [Clostridiales bacterium]|nr:MAG: excinuclease ABC subunit C [Clostridiales bacterium]
MSIADKLATLPDNPGVYLMKNQDGTIIYVGKAVNLKNRVRSYFRTLPPDALKTKALVRNIADFEYIIVDNEVEALVLECNLIKKYRPKYNISLKDDKTYPYLKITNEDYPRVIITRNYIKDGGKYFGPYPSVTVLRETLELLRSIFPFRVCKQRTFTNDRPCLNYQIKRCYAPCCGKISKEDYAQLIAKINDFFDGKHEELLADLTKQMNEAAENLHFEQAARLRDQIRGIERAINDQKAVLSGNDDKDVLGLAMGANEVIVQIFFIRAGKIVGRENYALHDAIDGGKAEILAAFIKQFYLDNQFIPPNILLEEELSEAEILQTWLSEKRGGKVQFTVPKRGQQKELVDLVVRNAEEELLKKRERALADSERLNDALAELQAALHLPRLPKRIECYDISNTQGTESVASMVVFVDGKAKKDQYRKFRIKTVIGPNDFASMNEVLLRRLGHMDTDVKFAKDNPDLIIVDGGKGQLAFALKALAEMGYNDIPIAGLAKKEEILFLPNEDEGVYLPRDSQALYLVQRIRDEAHRFAITFHRSLRGKRNLASVLDDIPGVGAKRKNALLRHFGSLTKITQATAEEIAEVEGIGEVLAEEIYEYLKTHQDLQARLKKAGGKI